DAFGVFIAGLNTGNFAGHNDWRLPNQAEQLSLIELGTIDPAVDPVFANNCGANSSGNAGCTVTTCSCTGQMAGYWSSTTPMTNPQFAWSVFFNFGFVGNSHKIFESLYARAVRGG